MKNIMLVQSDPGFLPAHHAPEQIDGHQHRHQQQLRQHTHHHTLGTLAGPRSKGSPAIAPPTIAPPKKPRNISMPHTMHTSVLEAT
ncbi:MAG: hypothetical protein Q4G06_11440 [Clostridia bacterium]|nr:hypothetical protein [Clostridia bacterium]